MCSRALCLVGLLLGSCEAAPPVGNTSEPPHYPSAERFARSFGESCPSGDEHDLLVLYRMTDRDDQRRTFTQLYGRPVRLSAEQEREEIARRHSCPVWGPLRRLWRRPL